MTIKKSKRLLKCILILLMPAGMLLVNILARFPHAVENIYARGFYRIISQALSLLTGWIPLSVGELAIILFIPFAIVVVIRSIVKLVKAASGRGSMAIDYILNVLVFVSLIYFSFVVTFDINYQRLPFNEIAGLDVHPSSVDELAQVCEKIIQRANELRAQVPEDSAGVMKLTGGREDAFRNAWRGYDIAAKVYPELGGFYGRPKGVMFSWVMSYMGIAGIENPLTAEANVNADIIDATIPSTACHEMAHQRGFAREDEANYISYLVCTVHPDPQFQYSGELLALIYSMNALYGSDREKFSELRKNYSPGIVRDLTANNRFWKPYEGPVSKTNSAVNDAYLKANRQSDGVQSYNRMVDLLIAEYRKTGEGVKK